MTALSPKRTHGLQRKTAIADHRREDLERGICGQACQIQSGKFPSSDRLSSGGNDGVLFVDTDVVAHPT